MNVINIIINIQCVEKENNRIVTKPVPWGTRDPNLRESITWIGGGGII